jgi:hypothetical protein
MHRGFDTALAADSHVKGEVAYFGRRFVLLGWHWRCCARPRCARDADRRSLRLDGGSALRRDAQRGVGLVHRHSLQPPHAHWGDRRNQPPHARRRLGGPPLGTASAGGDELPAIDEKGQVLWPEAYPVQALERIRQNTQPRFWSALANLAGDSGNRTYPRTVLVTDECL